MMGLESHSNSFVMDQYRYYSKHLGFRGNGWELIHGHWLQFEGEAIRRGLLKLDIRSNKYVEVSDAPSNAEQQPRSDKQTPSR